MTPATAPSCRSTASRPRGQGASSPPAARRASGMSRVVYIVSTDVVATSTLDVIDADEGLATYTDKFRNALSELRAQVKMMVLSADGNGRMRTCVLQPNNLFEPGDLSLLRFVSGYARSPLSKGDIWTQ